MRTLSSTLLALFLFSTLAIAPAEASKGSDPTPWKNYTNWRTRRVNRYDYTRRRIENTAAPTMRKGTTHDERTEILRKAQLKRQLEDAYRFNRSPRLRMRILELEKELGIEVEKVEQMEPAETDGETIDRRKAPRRPLLQRDSRPRGLEKRLEDSNNTFETCEGLTRTRLSRCYLDMQRKLKEKAREEKEDE